MRISLTRTTVSPGARTVVLLFLGTLLVQAAWVLAVPAFRGIDEFDHAYRAASVSRGEWVSSGRLAPHGRGELVTVPRDLVLAAGPECRARPYTEHDNCAPVGDATSRTVQVATAAARYDPLFYWLVGEPARGFHGTAALYAMRVTASLACALFVALAGWSVSLWARTRWPMVAVLASLTPVVMYSSTTVAPNGIEIVAALSVWAALAGLSTPGLPARTDRALLGAAVPGAMVLATVRSLGVGWLFLCVGTCLFLLGGARARELVGRQRRTVVCATLLVGTAVLGAVAWMMSARPNQLEEHSNYPGVVAGSLIQVPVWILQSVAIGVGRQYPAPGLVYATCGTLVAALVWAGLRRADARLRRLMLAIAVSIVLAPLLLTLATYRDAGVLWQGRYGLPWGLGLVVLAGVALDRRGPQHPLPRPWLPVAVGAYGFGQAVCAISVRSFEKGESPSVALGLWHVPSPWLLGLLVLAGWAVLGAVLLVRRGALDGLEQPRLVAQPPALDVQA